VTPVSARTVSSSRFVLHGRVRCTATVTTPVEAGHQIDVTFSLHNVSGSTARAPRDETSTGLVVRAGDGTRYDTAAAWVAAGYVGGPRMPVIIPSGETKTIGGPSVLVRWKGPLRITPTCERKPLPAVRIDVAAPGPPSTSGAAISDVVAATGGLLDHCRPEKPGVAVEGKIDSPGGPGSSMKARCSVTLRSEGRFLVAQVLMLIPPKLRGVHVVQPYDTLSWRRHVRRPYEAIAWQLVVTKKGAVTVAGSTHDATRAGTTMAPEWFWSGSSWGQPSAAKCGFEGYAAWPQLDLISVCP